MADERPTIEEQVNGWHDGFDRTLQHALTRLQGLEVHRNDPAAYRAAFTALVQDLGATVDDRKEAQAWAEYIQTPEYQTSLREQEDTDRAIAEYERQMDDPGYRGWIEEQRWNLSQGEPGDPSWEAYQAAEQELAEVWEHPGRYAGMSEASEIGPAMGSREAAEIDAVFLEHQAHEEDLEHGTRDYHEEPRRAVDVIREQAAALRAQGKGVTSTQDQGQGHGR